MTRPQAHISRLIAACIAMLALVALCTLASCGCSGSQDSGSSASKSPSAAGVVDSAQAANDGSQSGGSGQGASGGDASGSSEVISGAAFTQPASIRGVTFDSGAAVQGPNCAIDVSHVSEGYAAATATNSARLKFQVKCGDRSYNYDMPNDGSAIFVPLNMDNGNYTFRIMQNTSGNNYVELLSTSANVGLSTPFEPFLRPNVFCNFSEGSAAVRKARELTAGCATQADALRAICNFVVDNISYDNAKAERLSSSTGYVPDPDATLSSMTGICFDYASLSAAMLRSVGIPARIITGYVSPSGLYHAWTMVYIDGTWHTAQFSVNPNDWSRVDLTFASTGGNAFVGDGVGYEDRYMY